VCVEPSGSWALCFVAVAVWACFAYWRFIIIIIIIIIIISSSSSSSSSSRLVVLVVAVATM